MDACAVIDIVVAPKSSRSEVKIADDGSIKVYLNSPPVDGKANAECVKLFASKIKLPKSKIKIICGEKSKKKSIQIIGLSKSEVMGKLAQL